MTELAHSDYALNCDGLESPWNHYMLMIMQGEGVTPQGLYFHL